MQPGFIKLENLSTWGGDSITSTGLTDRAQIRNHDISMYIQEHWKL